MHRTYLIIAAVSGALAVAIGAFGAHGLKASVTPDVLEIYETGVRYQFYHTFALLATGILYRRMPGKLMEWAGILFISGIVLFCGSLYILTLLEATENVGLKSIGAITPLGGLCLIGGWICLFIQAMKPNTHGSHRRSSPEE